MREDRSQVPHGIVTMSRQCSLKASVIVNLILIWFGFSLSKIYLYVRIDNNEYNNMASIIILFLCRYVVGLVFGFEHLLLVVAVWLQWAISPTPKWVRLAIARREYLTKKRIAAAQRTTTRLGYAMEWFYCNTTCNKVSSSQKTADLLVSIKFQFHNNYCSYIDNVVL